MSIHNLPTLIQCFLWETEGRKNYLNKLKQNKMEEITIPNFDTSESQETLHQHYSGQFMAALLRELPEPNDLEKCARIAVQASKELIKELNKQDNG